MLVITVDTLVDVVDSGDGFTSLREAITMANVASGADTIDFAVTGEIHIIEQLPTIIDDLTITGPSADLLTIDAGGGVDNLVSIAHGDGFRIFDIDNGDLANQINVNLSGLTLTGGDVPFGVAGGGNVGGAIRNEENLTIDALAIVGNQGEFGGALGAGSSSTTTITNTLIANNFGSQNGGGISSDGTLNGINVTISGNAADGGGGGVFIGQIVDGVAALNLNHSTITGNTANQFGEGIAFFTSYGSITATLNNSIVDNTIEVGSAAISGSNNLFQQNGVSITGSNNLFNADPLLGPLADNGGPTQTHDLLPGSPAINAGGTTTLASDQRGIGFPREQLGQVDVGAVELQANDLVVSSTSDTNDGDYSAGELSLREAILLANNRPTADTITFDASVLSGGSASLIRLNGSELEITESLAIDASTATGVTITGDAGDNDALVPGTFITDVSASGSALLDDNVRVLNFTAGSGDLTLRGLTITGGRTTDDNPNNPVSTYSGGGVRFESDGTLHLTDGTVSGNSTMGRRARGGGIFSELGSVSLTSSTVNGNSTLGEFADGGGIDLESGSVTLTNSTVSGNSTMGDFARGGGINTLRGAVTLASSRVSGNSTAGGFADGGGIFTFDGAVALANSSMVSGNSTMGDNADGGGISTFYGAVTLTSSTVSGNSTAGGFADGGGISTNSGSVSLTSSTVNGNNTTGGYAKGGGIYADDAAVTLTSSTVSGNSTMGFGSDGGGIYAYSGAVTFTSSTVSGNRTTGDNADGGGIYARHGAVTLASSTVSGNEARGAGGGVIVFGNVATTLPLTIDNSIVAGNLQGKTSSNAGTPNDLAPDPNRILAINHSLIGVADGLTITGNVGNLAGTAAIPLDPMLDPLADNGGPTQTHALLLGSPAFNAGDPEFVEPPEFDQRGSGFSRVGFGRVDMGSFEFVPFVDTSPNLVVQTPAGMPTLLEVRDDNGFLFGGPTTRFASLDIEALASQDDSLTVDYTNGFFSLINGIRFAGNSGDNDQLLVVGDTTPQGTRAAYEANFGSGSVETRNGLGSNVISFSDAPTVDLRNLLSFDVDGILSIGTGETLHVDALGFAQLGSVNVLNGGTLNAPSGVNLGSGLLTGNGILSMKVASGTGSTIVADGALNLGDDSSVNGFFSDGELHVGVHTVTIHDSNEAVLGALTTLGDGAGGGILDSTSSTATNSGLPLDFLLEAGKNVTGRGEVRGNFNNMGSVIGDGTTMSERIVFAAGFTVKGIGYAENVLYQGTHAPGLSPAAVTGKNQAFGGTLQIELGGATPGGGPNSHDQVMDLGGVELVRGVELEVLPWNGFQPGIGDAFEVLVTTDGLTGKFDGVIVDPSFAQQGIDFVLDYGANALTLRAVAVIATGDFNADGVVSGADFLTWQRGESPNPLSTSDLEDWQRSFGQSASIVAVSRAAEAASAPQLSQPDFPEFGAADLVDAALAWDLAPSVGKSDDEVAGENAPLDKVFEVFDAFGKVALLSRATTNTAETTADDFVSAEQSEAELDDVQWLADELLERVFA